MMVYLFVILGIFACSCSQLLLKHSADREHKSFIASMLNWRVILSYGILLASMAINIVAMGKGVGLKEMPILEGMGYVFVPLLSLAFLKEHIGKREIAAIALILAGIYVFYA